jgi:heme oxygenase
MSTPVTIVPAASISDHASAEDGVRRPGLGPRLRRLHGRVGKAHHQAEGMAFPRSLLAGEATPLQLAALIRALAPAYALLEERAPALASALGAHQIPWAALARRPGLDRDCARLAALPATPPSAAAAAWLERLDGLARQAPHRLLAHVYVRYGGDLSGGQQLAQRAGAILAAHGLPALDFWRFSQPIAELKQQLHDGYEALELSDAEEEELLAESEVAFHATQQLLAELAQLS